MLRINLIVRGCLKMNNRVFSRPGYWKRGGKAAMMSVPKGEGEKLPARTSG
jgi:hypothetical protein